MNPTLRDGEEVVTIDTRSAVPGNLVVLEHPERRDFWLVKRLRDESGWVVSDDPTTVGGDSAQFGPVPLNRLAPVVERLDTGTFVEISEFLAQEDPALAQVIEEWGIPEFWARRPGFETLVLLILEQQVSLESGAAMYHRLLRLTRKVSPESVIEAGTDGLRGIGVTAQKSSYLVGLAQSVLNGDLDLDEIENLRVDEARNRLMALRGIGEWTADAYLLSAGRRPDMWPVGDRALQVGTGEAIGASAPLDPEELEIVGERWRPVRAVAARLIWHAYLSRRRRVEPPDATLAHPPDERA